VNAAVDLAKSVLANVAPGASQAVGAAQELINSYRDGTLTAQRFVCSLLNFFLFVWSHRFLFCRAVELSADFAQGVAETACTAAVPGCGAGVI
jgi:hypothetical protein